MNDKIMVNIKDIKEIDEYLNGGVSNFLVPLENFGVGYETISISDISQINKNFYLLINRILTTKEILKLKDILVDLKNPYIKGIFFEDIGIWEVLKEIDKPWEKIYYPNHFGTNYASINSFLNRGIDSMVVSNELTYKEIEEITKKVLKPVVINVYGYNQIMYSRRNLISNFNAEFDLDLEKDNEIREKITKKQLKIKENQYGTVIFDEKIYQNFHLMDLKDNIKFYYVNTTFLEVSEVLNAISEQKQGDDSGFLNRKTVYKIGDLNE